MKANQETFIRALLTGSSIKQAALESGISERQATRWLASDAIKAELLARQKQLADEFSSGLLSSSLDALNTLRELLDSKHAPNIRRMAASSLLEHRLRWIDAIDFENRLSALEARAYDK